MTTITVSQVLHQYQNFKNLTSRLIQSVSQLLFMTKTNSDKKICLVQIISATFVLEVFGGGGAIWGFSEAIGFRVPSTVWFWRPCALAFGVIFFEWWLLQIQDYILEENILIFGGKAARGEDNKQVSLTKTNSVKILIFVQIFSTTLVLEVFGGGGAIWGFSEAIGFCVPLTVWFWRPCALTFGAIFFGRWLL